MAEANKLAVLGSPIAHSKSPALHLAAYAVLGLDWSYEAIEVTGATLAEFVSSRDAQWRGLSLTMPLKRDVLPLLDGRDEIVALTGAANTVLFDRSGRDSGGVEPVIRGFNTDVYGVTQSFRAAGITRLDGVRIIGGGATAASVIVAVSQLGATRVDVSARTPERASSLVRLGELLGIDVTLRQFGIEDPSLIAPDAIVSTLPGHSQHDLVFAASIREEAVLFDVAYDPWPSAFARSWLEVGGTVIPGLDMLLHQAVAQIRIFVNGDPDAALPNESAVIAAMRRAVSA